MGGWCNSNLPIAGRGLREMHATDYNRTWSRRQGDRSIVPGLVLMGLALTVGLLALFALNDGFDAYPYLFLLPWIFGLALLMAAPLAMLYYQGKFSFVDPLVFATLSYFFPAFVLGGLFFAGGWSQPPFLSLIQDAYYTLPLTIIIVALGFSGLSVGYLLPVGAKLGSLIARKLPAANYAAPSLILPAILLLLSGVLAALFALTIGRFGYQITGEVNSYDGLINLTTLFWSQASFLLWLIIFRQKKIGFMFVPIIVLLSITSLGKFLLAGNRSTVIGIFLTVAFAYILSGRKVTIKRGVVGGLVLSVGLIVGMIYGTTFRNVKGTEDAQSTEQYAGNILETFDEVGRYDMYDSVEFGFTSLTERVDILSTLAVVVSNYQQLKPYEEAYGLDNNIWTDSTTFWIPRVLWPEKPSASDPRKYSDLYFNFGASSYAITPMGDLLRNYGVVGVPLGMFILGVLLRLIYSTLVEGLTPIFWRLTLFFMLMMSVSYEGFYGTIIPSLVRTGLTVAVCILIINLVAKKMDSRGAAVQE